MMSTSTQQKERKTRFNFNPRRDICLLKAAVQNEVWMTGKWCQVEKELKLLKYDVTKKSVKERCEHLMLLYRSESLKVVNKSGTEEEFDERANLLRELCEFFDSEKIIVVHGPEGDEIDEFSLPLIDENEIIDPSDFLDVVVEKDAEVPVPITSVRLEVPSTSTLVSPEVHNSSTSSKSNPIPCKKMRLMDKIRADQDRDQARDDMSKNSTQCNKKVSHMDMVEEKMKFDMEMRRKEVELKEKELDLKDNSQTQDFKLRKIELENEQKRLEIAAQSNANNTLMLKLMEKFMDKDKNKDKDKD